MIIIRFLFMLIHCIFALSISQGGFVDSCNDLKLVDTSLHASCRRNSGEYMDTWLDLNGCIGNNNGHIVVREPITESLHI